MREAWNKGKTMSDDFKNKIKSSLVGKTGSNARNWKGEKAGYVALHIWVKKELGKPIYCSIDKISMCPSCHRIYDKCEFTLERMKQYASN